MNALLAWLSGYGKNPNNTQLLRLVRHRIATRASPVKTSLRQVVHSYRACPHAGTRHILYICTLHCYTQQHTICQFLPASELYARALCSISTSTVRANLNLHTCCMKRPLAHFLDACCGLRSMNLHNVLWSTSGGKRM